MTPNPNEKRRAYFREYRRRWREANREKYLALNKQKTAKKHATLKRIAELEAEVARLKQEKNELAVMIHPVALKAWIQTKGWKGFYS